MNPFQMMWQYYLVRWQASVETDRDRGEISTTTVALTAALVLLAIAVGTILSTKVKSKANGINLG